jgi:hypothetical protein
MPDEIKQQFTIDSAQALQALNQLDTGFAKLSSTISNLSATLSAFNGSSAQASTAAKNFGASVQSNLGGATQATERLTVSWGLLARVVTVQTIVSEMRRLKETFKDAVESAIEFENRIHEIATISPETGIAQLSADVRELSRNFNVPELQVAKAAYEAISDGFMSAAQKSDVLNAALKFSKATFTDASASLSLITGTLNAFSLDSSEAEKVAAQLFETIRLGKVTGTDLAGSLSRVAPVADELGISLSEVLADFATLTIRGTKASEAATQFGATLSALIKPSSQAEQSLIGVQLGADRCCHPWIARDDQSADWHI